MLFEKYMGKRKSSFLNNSCTNIEGGNMNQESLRVRLNDVIASGLVAKAIAKQTDITTDVLSRFKNGHVCLCSNDADRLQAYLDKVVIPR